MLNKNDPRIQETLDLILHSQKLKLRPNRLMFPFSIIVENKQAVQINIVAPEGKNWYPLVNCLVAWEMEAEFIKIRSEFKDSILIELLKYKEAFTSQYRFVQKRLKEKQEISEKERWLYQVIDKGFLSEFILWEIIASARPNIILLLPADKRQRIIDYLYQFVYEPAK